MGIAAHGLVAKLEARFHPPGKGLDAYVVVGHVTWPDDVTRATPSIEPFPALALTPAPATILSTLRCIVTASRSIEQLESMRNPYWSFVRTVRAP